MSKKEITISFMEKSGNLPRGIYIFKKPNTWYPAVYFKKAKYVDGKTFEQILGYIKALRDK